MNIPMRGLRCEILRTRYATANGGLSDTHLEVVLVGPEVPQLHPVREDAPAVIIAPTKAHLRPLVDVPSGRLGYMHSGSYVMCSGAMAEWQKIFGHRLPVPLHDYSETHDHYRHACE